MKLDILCTDGSPLGVTVRSLYGQDGRVGVGGAEYALLTMCEEWSKLGWDVTLYNDGDPNGSPFEHRPKDSFHPQADRDVLITFRTPNEKSIGAKGYKVWWSCDQYTSAPFQNFYPHVEKVVTISDFHKKYFEHNYGMFERVEVIDLPVRLQDYEGREVEKVPGRCIFTSVPDRGLDILHAIWPLIVRDVPEATLVITSDYRLWGCDSPLNFQHRSKFAGYKSVDFVGAVSRDRLIEEQLEAQLLIYPCTYEELFCIACAEAQVAGALPITSITGALETTNMGYQIEGNPTKPKFVAEFHEQVFRLLHNPKLLEAANKRTQRLAKERFDPKYIVKQWNEKVFDEDRICE